jgi:8-oxo-dGTP diphosphatase
MSCFEALQKPRPDAPPGLPVVLVVAAALINADGQILVAQRPEGKSMAGLWEFPGGKVQEGETPEYALTRELFEELGVESRETCFSPLAFASHSYDDFHLMMPLYALRVWENEPTGKEGQKIKWVKPRDLYDLDMPPADIPLISQILDRL